MTSSEAFHSLVHAAQSQIHDVKLIKCAFVSSYDEDKDAVKVIIPQDRGEEDDSDAAETDWIPLMSFAVGDGWGFQWAPKGGATPEEPELGEEVAILILNRSMGLFVCPMFIFDETRKPPGSGKDNQGNTVNTGDDNQQDEEDKQGWDDDPKGQTRLKGGEMVFRHESGSFAKFYENGDMQTYCAGTNHMYMKQDADIVVREGDFNVKVEKGNTNITVDKGDTTIQTTLGNTLINSESGNITASTASGDVEVSTESGTATVSATDVEILGEAVVNVTAPLVNLGEAGDYQPLATLDFVEWVLTHQHEGVMPGDGVTSTPNDPPPPTAPMVTESTLAT